MKKTILLSLLILPAISVRAATLSPAPRPPEEFLLTGERPRYFRLVNPAKRLHMSIGKLLGESGTAVAYAVVTHSTRDGCALPAIVCEDWAPLTVGSTGDRDRFFFGPSANLLPVAKSFLLKGLNAASKEGQYANLKELLSPPLQSTTDLTVAFGPVLVIEPWNGWFSRIRFFAGAAWTF